MSSFKPEKIHRVIIKLSGEILSGKSSYGFDESVINSLAEEIIEIKRIGYSIGIVIGGGNIFRGGRNFSNFLNRVNGDNIGMLATVQNSLMMSDCIRRKNYKTQVFSAVKMDKITDFYTPELAKISLSQGNICFFAAGTGNPYFTTDTAAVLRALEVEADIVLKGTKVDGVYTADPEKDKSAVYIKEIDYDNILAKKLNVMDMTAFSLARDYKIPMKIFNVTKKGYFKEALVDDEVGTYIS